MTDDGQSNISTESVGTHNRTRVTIAGDLHSLLSRWTVVDEDFGIGANTDDVVPRG